MICQICNCECSLPLTLTCGDDFCFLCIKTYYMDGGMECPLCEQFITDDLNNIHFKDYKELNNIQKYRWLYSSNFHDRWWGYDDNSNKKIEMIYNDYQKRHHDFGDDDSSLDSDESEDVNIPDLKVKLPIKIRGKGRPASRRIVIDEGKSFVPYYPSDEEEFVFEPIEFQESESSSESNSQEEEINSSSKQESQNPKPQISYIIKVGSANYKIDFDQNKQVHIEDPRKQRQIKRIQIPENLSEHQLIAYMKSQGVVGISGLKF